MAHAIEQEYEKVRSELSEVQDKLKAFAEDVKKATREMNDETRAKVDEALSNQTELQNRLQQAEQEIVNADRNHGHKPAQTLGRMVVENAEFSEQLQAMQGTRRGSATCRLNAAILEQDDSGGDLIDPQRVPGIISQPERNLTIRDLLRWGTTASNAVEYVEETGFTNSADVVSENPSGGKPESDLTFDLKSASVVDIAHIMYASKQIVEDVPQLESYVNGRMRYGLKLKEETQLLKGSGSGLNINGINTAASSYSNPGVNPQNETELDRLRLAMLQVALAEYMADGIVLNPIDWTQIELLKDANNQYLFARPQNDTTPRLWGLPVVATQSQDNNDFTVGAFAMGAQGWDRQQAVFEVSTENKDNFEKNMVTMRMEERIALTIYRPEAFVTGSLQSLSS